MLFNMFKRALSERFDVCDLVWVGIGRRDVLTVHLSNIWFLKTLRTSATIKCYILTCSHVIPFGPPLRIKKVVTMFILHVILPLKGSCCYLLVPKYVAYKLSKKNSNKNVTSKKIGLHEYSNPCRCHLKSLPAYPPVRCSTYLANWANR